MVSYEIPEDGPKYSNSLAQIDNDSLSCMAKYLYHGTITKMAHEQNRRVVSKANSITAISNVD
jgi:hypothetical protein